MPMQRLRTPKPTVPLAIAAALALASTSARSDEPTAAPTQPPTAQPPAAQPPTAAAPPRLDAKKLVPPKPTPELLEKGKLAFSMSCVACHGEKGTGDGPAGLVLNPRPRDFTKDPFRQGQKPADVFVSITEGVKDTPMVGWSHLSEDERWALTYHVLSLVPKATGSKGSKAAKAKTTP